LGREFAVAVPAANQQQNHPSWLPPSSTLRKMYEVDLAEPPAPLMRLIYQGESRHRKIAQNR